ncbi:MAG: sulfotransferase [Pseudomonadales bacterium]|nr:sulfotransferase [Pseudomonadales bacterium]
MFYYFDFRTWFTLIRLAARESNPRQRRGLMKLLLLIVPLRAVAHALFFFLDGILFPGLWRVNVRAPVFVIGHARSGTTLAHRLLSGDERFSTFRYWELMLPSLTEKKLVHLVAWIDRTLLGRRIEKRLDAWEQRKFGPTQHIHKMGLNIPEEDDLILQHSCASGFWMTQLPYMGEMDFFHVDQRPPRSRQRMMRFYRECVRRQLYLNGSHHIHLSKNPTWCGRVQTLIEVFPDARFVVLYRNPYETIPSLLKLLHVGWKRRGTLEESHIRESTRVMAELSYEHYLLPLQVLARNPQVRHADVDYRELTTRPRATIAQVYAALDMEMTPQMDAFLAAEESRARKHETEHRYSLAEFGLDDREIRRRLAPLFERFGWDPDGAVDVQPAQNSDHD